MRLNRTGAVIIATFLLVGVAMAIAPSGPLRVMGIIYLVTTLVACLVVLRARSKIHHNRWLARNGILGKATIVAADSEMSINEQPVFRVVFDADVPGQASRRLERTIVVGSFAARRMRPGVVMPLYVHPRKPDDLLLVW